MLLNTLTKADPLLGALQAPCGLQVCIKSPARCWGGWSVNRQAEA